VSDARPDLPPKTPLARYIAGLPEGLDSYPDFRIKAAFSRSLLDELPTPPVGLPGPIGELVAHPPMISAWIPEVHHQALIVGVVERVFDGDQETFLDLMLRMQRRLLGRKIYAPLLQLIDPSRLLKQAAKRWTNFHRGTTLEVTPVGDREARVGLPHPAGLFSTPGRRALAGGFRAAIEAGRTHEADVTVVEASAERTEFRLRWS
jgi:hypothetical protein